MHPRRRPAEDRPKHSARRILGLRIRGLIGTDATRASRCPRTCGAFTIRAPTTAAGAAASRSINARRNARAAAGQSEQQAEQTRALTRALVDWVTKGTPPPPSRYPTLANGDLVPATRAALGMPEIPGLPFSDRLLNPVLRYDFGPGFHAADLSGVMTRVPPRVIGVLPTYVPRVNEDGNETSGVPSVQLQAPLGTYLGWNTFRAGVFAGHGCGFQGGWIPFAKTKAERIANRDPRLSIEERYGTREGIGGGQEAAEQRSTTVFLLPDDAARIRAPRRRARSFQPSQPAVSASPACEQLTSFQSDERRRSRRPRLSGRRLHVGTHLPGAGVLPRRRHREAHL